MRSLRPTGHPGPQATRFQAGLRQARACLRRAATAVATEPGRRSRPHLPEFAGYGAELGRDVMGRDTNVAILGEALRPVKLSSGGVGFAEFVTYDIDLQALFSRFHTPAEFEKHIVSD